MPAASSREKSPRMREGEAVTVTGMLAVEDCMGEIIVLIGWCGRTLGVPLIQVDGIDVDADTSQAIADWHYWVA